MKSIIFASRARKSKEVRYTVWNYSDSQHTVPTFIQRVIMLPTSKSGNRTRRINCTHLQSLPHHHRRATFAQRDMPRFTVGRGAPRGLGMPKIFNFFRYVDFKPSNQPWVYQKNPFGFILNLPSIAKNISKLFAILTIHHLFIFIITITITSNPFARQP